MILNNIQLGKNVSVHETTSINNVMLGDSVRISKRCSIFGGESAVLEISDFSYVGMGCVLNGYSAVLKIGRHCSIAQNVNIMTNSGPNASDKLQKLYPLIEGPVSIGDHCWIGAGAIIMPNVTLGDYCIIAAGAFVNSSFESYSIVGGVPAKEIRKFTASEIDVLNRD